MGILLSGFRDQCGQVDDVHAVLQRIAIGVSRATGAGTTIIGNAYAATVDHFSISLQHAAVDVGIGGIMNTVRMLRDLSIERFFIPIPKFILMATRQI